MLKFYLVFNLLFFGDPACFPLLLLKKVKE